MESCTVAMSLTLLASLWTCNLAAKCSDEVPLTDNVNGMVVISPGDTILRGTNFTITCRGIHGQPGKKIHNPLHYNITVINIFDSSDEMIHSCQDHSLTSCSVNQQGVHELKTRKFTCSFRTRSNMFSCYISKNLTITDKVCSLSTPPCHPNASCNETQGNSYYCMCKQGFSGNGTHCEAIKECSQQSPCHSEAHCTKLQGSHNCSCRQGFKGNGTYCERIDNCTLLNLRCHRNATCGAFGCECGKGFLGNGTYCIAVKASKTNKIWNISQQWIIIPVCGVVLLVVAVSILLYCKSRNAIQVNQEGATNASDNLGILFPVEEKVALRRLPSIADYNRNDGNRDEDMSEMLTYIYVLDDWEIERNNLTIHPEKLGGGQFGVVKKGTYHEKINDDVTVAVKMLKDVASTSDRSDLLMELHILKEVNKEPHPNVINLIGAYTSEEPILVLTEYCGRGNLRKVLRNSRIKDDHSSYVNIFSKLPQRILLNIAVEIANGMKHLAEHQFVHRDLSARNVLIGVNYEAKVSDFGLARPITGIDQMYIKSNRNLLPVKWMALESLTHGVFRTSSDVWAFGILLWEITTLGDEPYPDISPYDILNFLATDKRMSQPRTCSQELYELMSKCWKADQGDRPDFLLVHEQLTKMLDDKQKTTYINIVEVNDEKNENPDESRERFQSDLERYTKG